MVLGIVTILADGRRSKIEKNIVLRMVSILNHRGATVIFMYYSDNGFSLVEKFLKEIQTCPY